MHFNMTDILKRILEGLGNTPNKKENIIRNSCIVASQITKKPAKTANNEAVFYGKNSQLIVENHTIKDAFMYFNEYNNPHNNLNIAINTKPANSESFYYYDSISRTFNDFNKIEKEAFLEWLEFHKYNNNEITPHLFLCLYFRNLQHRAIVDGKDLNDILFESIKFLNFYAKNSYYYFKDNMLDLITYLIFKIENFTEEERTNLLDFIENYRTEYKQIDNLYDSFVIKIKSLKPDEYLKEKYKNFNDKNVLIKAIYDYIKNVDFYKSKSKFYNFRPIFFNKTFKKQPLMLIAFKILLISNKIDLEKDFRISYTKTTSRYSNYYLDYEYEKNFDYYAIEYEVALPIKKALYKAYEMIDNYEEDKKKFLKNKASSSLTDKEKFTLLPEIIQKYLNKSNEKKTKNNETKIDFNIDFTKLNSIQNDTFAIHNTLTDIFKEENEVIEPQQQNVVNNNEKLDKKYVDFINFLKQKNVWEEDELKNYCRQNKLMLNNAISIINDYYDDNYDNYLIEEDNNLFYIHNF